MVVGLWTRVCRVTAAALCRLKSPVTSPVYLVQSCVYQRLSFIPYNIVYGHTRGPGGISASAQVVNTPDLRQVDRQRLRPAAHGPSMLRRQLMLCSAMATYLLWPRFHLGIYWENESRRHRHDMLIYFDPVLAI